MRKLALAGKPIYVTSFLFYLYKAHGWLTEDEEELGRPDTFIEDFVVSDEETAAEESTPTRTPPKKNTPKTSVIGRSKTSVPEKTTQKVDVDYSESSGFDSEDYKEEQEVVEDSESEKEEELKTTPDIDQVAANTEVTPDEELLAQEVPLSSAALPKRQSTVRKKTSAVTPTRKPALKRVRHLDLGVTSSDEDKQKRVLSRLSALARERGAPMDKLGNLETILLQAIQGWKKAEAGSSSASTLQSELKSYKAELSSVKKQVEDLTQAKTSETERLAKLKEKLADSRHEEKRSPKRMKSA
ncbi:hypothetical protein R1sor_020603 [Riccia sorocarpa]|uniref:Uncharacterized protein n=1 Tax=Riccia sorocarpa TaxID=122646 RepID=A0ABD3IK48_9MARC